jgi:hypothetical protein
MKPNGLRSAGTGVKQLGFATHKQDGTGSTLGIIPGRMFAIAIRRALRADILYAMMIRRRSFFPPLS